MNFQLALLHAFLSLFLFVSDNLERIVEIAKLRAMQKKARFAKLKISLWPLTATASFAV